MMWVNIILGRENKQNSDPEVKMNLGYIDAGD